jgi:hypothetical protein
MAYNTPFENIGTSKVWDHKEGDEYIVTGKDRNGKRFRLVFDNWIAAQSINLWSGHRWLLRNGIRYLISKVSN